jgi:DNA gyrase subunit A
MDKNEKNNISLVPITREMQKAYLDYAMSVIVDRALPEVGDGLKPSQRRILIAMSDLGLTAAGKYRKCAKIAGDTSGNYHPHGEQVVYPTLVRLAQDFNLRYPLVDGQGNFGSIDGDPPAAMRYTEARMTRFGELMLKDLDKETVEFRSTYDGSREEPVILPALLPNLIINGATGIAVGMATSIPPHNLSEVVDALAFMIDELKILPQKDDSGKEITQTQKASYNRLEMEIKTKPFAIDSDATIEDLMRFIKGPDFPTGGEIYDQKEIIQAYATGKGRIVMRARAVIEEGQKGAPQIVVTEIPYQVNKAKLIAKIAQLVKDEKIKKIRDLRDESDREGLRIVVELKKEARPQQILNLLYKHTELQSAFNANLVALVDGQPRVLTLKLILEEFLRHRQRVTVNRTIYLLKRAKHRAHILKGLKIALDNIDAVIETIKKSKDQETAKINLVKKFKLTEIQATAILDMQLRRLAALERQKIEDELTEKLALITSLEELLLNPQKLMQTVKEELLEVKEKFGDPRRSKVFPQKAGELADKDMIESAEVIVTLTRSGYIKRMPRSTYKPQGRGGKGVLGASLKEGDAVCQILSANTHDKMLFFTNQGKIYTLKAWDIPEARRRAKGTAIVNVLNLQADERVSALLNLAGEDEYLLMVTRNGTIKKTALAAFQNIRRTGIIAIKLAQDDELDWVKTADRGDEVMLITAAGKSIRFNGADVRATGRAASGVRGIRLNRGDRVVSAEIVRKSEREGELLTVSQNGYGKLTKLSEYRGQNRGGTGIFTAKLNPKTGPLVDARVVTNKDGDVLLTSTSGQVIRLPLGGISVMSRATQGVRLMKLKAGDKVAALTCL